MRYGNHNSLKIIKIILQHHKRPNIQIVRGLIQNQNIRCSHQHLQKIQSTLFATGQLSKQTVLLLPLKQKFFQHLGCRNTSILSLYIFGNIPDIVNHPFLRRHLYFIDFLCIITDFNCLSYGNASRIRLTFSCQNLH